MLKAELKSLALNKRIAVTANPLPVPRKSTLFDDVAIELPSLSAFPLACDDGLPPLPFVFRRRITPPEKSDGQSAPHSSPPSEHLGLWKK